jgi:hypothetical protein
MLVSNLEFQQVRQLNHHCIALKGSERGVLLPTWMKVNRWGIAFAGLLCHRVRQTQFNVGRGVVRQSG